MESLKLEDLLNLHSYSTTYNKMYEISYGIITAMAGHLDTAEAWLNTVHAEYRRSINRTHIIETVEQVAQYTHENLGIAHPIMAGTVKYIVAGYDNGIANLWETDINRNVQPEDGIAVIGSSQASVREFIKDNGYDFYMGKVRAAELARRAICDAGLTDIATGGDSIKVFLIKDGGVEIISKDTFADLKLQFNPDYPMEELMVESEFLC
ncbi:hypothetical protein MKW94_029461 [Papaver nudicaule]|uniref:Uncharacterized protein n=1 Tax=Papaver nudicaule TaxID=74823 RepID=A0AA41V3E9_PAPNU|nr:hypothetical protein [Papaver nudicaule]